MPLPELVLNAFAEHVRMLPPAGEALFTDEHAELLRRNRFNEVWRKAVVAAKAPAGTGFHDRRHFYKPALETLDTYGHLWPEDEDLTRRAIDAVFEAPAANLRPNGGGHDAVTSTFICPHHFLKY
ncbi:MAG: hypothetical protein ACRDZ3_11185 [Acidimicrobiia bacterium]